MLTRLHLQNFKAWQDTGARRLAPLTVYFGANSSGKSSLNQFLLLLKQTVESADRKSVFHTGDASTPVDLGSYRDMIFEHETSRPLNFSFRWSLGSPMRIRDPKSGDAFAGADLGFSAEVVDVDPERGAPQLEVRRMTYTLSQQGETVLSVGMESEPTTRARRFQLVGDEYRLVRNMGRKWELPPPQRFYGFPDEAVLYYQNSAFTSDLTVSLEQMLRGITYLGPLRELPRRIYTWPGDTPEHVGWGGERSIDAILAARERRISPGYRRPAQQFEAVVAKWLRALGLIEAFRIRPISEHSQVNEVVVRTTGRQDVLLTDVGFGVSQVLPVIVQCFYAAPGSTIILEQPELHLHPAVQARLADLFIETIQARENGADRNIQLIIESHSEHFLRRLMRRVSEEAIDPSDVALYFCEPRANGSRIYELDVDLFGNIRNWPTDFFGNPMDDIATQAETALRRQLAST